jgi:hypothetical protein
VTQNTSEYFLSLRKFPNLCSMLLNSGKRLGVSTCQYKSGKRRVIWALRLLRDYPSHQAQATFKNSLPINLFKYRTPVAKQIYWQLLKTHR